MVDSTELTYIILGLTLLGMIWYMTNRGRANLAKAREDAAPAIAGAMFWTVLQRIQSNSMSLMMKPLKKWLNFLAKMSD